MSAMSPNVRSLSRSTGPGCRPPLGPGYGRPFTQILSSQSSLIIMVGEFFLAGICRDVACLMFANWCLNNVDIHVEKSFIQMKRLANDFTFFNMLF